MGCQTICIVLLGVLAWNQKQSSAAAEPCNLAGWSAWSPLRTELKLSHGNTNSFQALQLDVAENDTLLAILGAAVVKIEQISTNPALKSYIGKTDTGTGWPNNTEMENFGSRRLNAVFKKLADMVQLSNDLLIVADPEDNCLKIINRTTKDVKRFSGICVSTAQSSQDGPSLSGAFLVHPFKLALFKHRLFIIERGVADLSTVRSINLQHNDLFVNTIYKGQSLVDIHPLTDSSIILTGVGYYSIKLLSKARGTWKQTDIKLPGDGMELTGAMTVLTNNTIAYISHNRLIIHNLESAQTTDICGRNNDEMCKLSHPSSLLWYNGKLYVGEDGENGAGIKQTAIKGCNIKDDPGTPLSDKGVSTRRAVLYNSSSLSNITNITRLTVSMYASNDSFEKTRSERADSLIGNLTSSTIHPIESTEIVNSTINGDQISADQLIGLISGVLAVTLAVLLMMIQGYLSYRRRSKRRTSTKETKNKGIRTRDSVGVETAGRPLPVAHSLVSDGFYFDIQSDIDSIYSYPEIPNVEPDIGMYVTDVTEQRFYMYDPRCSYDLRRKDDNKDQGVYALYAVEKETPSV